MEGGGAVGVDGGNVDGVVVVVGVVVEDSGTEDEVTGKVSFGGKDGFGLDDGGGGKDVDGVVVEDSGAEVEVTGRVSLGGKDGVGLEDGASAVGEDDAGAADDVGGGEVDGVVVVVVVVVVRLSVCVVDSPVCPVGVMVGVVDCSTLWLVCVAEVKLVDDTSPIVVISGAVVIVGVVVDPSRDDSGGLAVNKPNLLPPMFCSPLCFISTSNMLLVFSHTHRFLTFRKKFAC